MAIERWAIFALSIAFSTSLILYPDLPPDIPPRRDGPFVGALFVAFFLPTAAAALWWILGALNRAERPLVSSVVRARAVTMVFLSVFHLIMLSALIGDHPWLSRVLGAVVGLFLVVTGNDLPRTRPTMMWGVSRLGTPDHRVPIDVWWWRRVVGYVRVGTGVALLAAGLLDVPGLWRLIVLGAGAEVVLRVAAGMVGRRVRRAIATGAVMSLAAMGGVAQAQGIPGDGIEALPAVVDAAVPKLMAAGHVPGTAVAIVYQGRVLLLRGYCSRIRPGSTSDLRVPTRTRRNISSRCPSTCGDGHLNSSCDRAVSIDLDPPLRSRAGGAAAGADVCRVRQREPGGWHISGLPSHAKRHDATDVLDASVAGPRGT